QEAACTVFSIKVNDDEQRDELILAIAYNDISRNMEKILSDFHQLCLDLPEDLSFRPAIGELIAAYYEAYEQWVRAVVLSEGLNRWLVACCDFGVVLEVKKIQRMPTNDDFSKIPSFAARCRIRSSWLPRDDLFSEEWIKVPCFAVKIGLKRKFVRLLNKNASFYLTSLTEGSEELLLLCPDGNLRSCDLLMSNGCLLSDILKELVDPSS
ncbi:hypothetical protein J437_LFUL005080, partial [Ladona fulva]